MAWLLDEAWVGACGCARCWWRCAPTSPQRPGAAAGGPGPRLRALRPLPGHARACWPLRRRCPGYSCWTRCPPERGDRPVAVDLVLDLGNARTCGILIEEHPDEGLSMADSYPLALRDLSRPELLHAKPFDSRVEFSRASFGRDAIARKAGRGSFVWPARCGWGRKRCGWRRPGGQRGRQRPVLAQALPVGRAPEHPGLALQRPRRGRRPRTRRSTAPFMALVDEEGFVLPRGRLKQPAVRAGSRAPPCSPSCWRRSCCRPCGQMNAPGGRAQRRDADKPRRLRSVVLTMPPGMPVAEQALLRSGRRWRCSSPGP